MPVPDTVQTDHVDWGMHVDVLYGYDYHFTQMSVMTTTRLKEQWTVQVSINGSNDVAVWNRTALQVCVRWVSRSNDDMAIATTPTVPQRVAARVRQGRQALPGHRTRRCDPALLKRPSRAPEDLSPAVATAMLVDPD